MALQVLLLTSGTPQPHLAVQVAPEHSRLILWIIQRLLPAVFDILTR